MDLREIIKEIKLNQKEYVEIQNEIKTKVDKCSKELVDEFLKRWEQNFPGTKPKILSGLEGGCLTDDWDPELYFYNVDNKIPTDKGFWVENDYRREYIYETSEKADPPVDLDKMLQFLKDFEEEVGIPVSAPIIEVKSAVDRISSFSDIAALYPNAVEFESGSVWYKGWEVDDKFWIALTDDGYVAVFSSFNNDTFIVEPGDEDGLNDFFSKIEQDSDNDSLRRKYQNLIVKSWEEELEESED